MYLPRRPFSSRFETVRGLRHHLWCWGEPQAGQPLLALLHGWMDVGASYQFMVDALAADRAIVAPDWRGFGHSAAGGSDHYVFADYLADLDFLLDRLAGDQAVDLVGHSMGGNIAMLYAGVRPQRVRRLVNLEGFGMPETRPEQAPARYAHWMDELKGLHRGELALQRYDSLDGVAGRLMKTNPRLARDAAGQAKARWLAGHWAQPVAQPDGSTRWEVLGEPAHKLSSAQLFRLEEVLACYARITAPVLAVEASDNSLARWWGERYTLAQYHQRLTVVPNLRTAQVQDAGHMLHHDQPQALARLVEDFLA